MEKNPRQKGYDVLNLLVEPIKEGLRCQECDLILRDAVQTYNGHRICFKCFQEIEKMPNGTSVKTRICYEEDGELCCYPDKAVRREVQSLEIKCEFGCPWIGQLGFYFKEHCKSCPKSPWTCELCNEQMTLEQIEDHRLKDCPNNDIVCCCGDVIERDRSRSIIDSMDLHLQQPGTIFVHFGQLGLSIKRNHRDHCAQVAALETKLAVSNRQMAQLQHQMHALQQTVESLSPRATYRHYPRQLRHGSIGEKETREIKDSDTVRQTQNSGNQTSDFGPNTDHIPALVVEDFDLRVTQRRLSVLECRATETEKQVSILKVHASELELQLQASLASTHNGSFLWRIPDIPRRKREAVEERITSIYSPPFYTGRNGYKMCIRAYLNGDGMGYKTHLSLFFVVMKGEFDALLKWPFDYKVSLILVDQNHRKHIVQTFKPTAESNSFQRPVSDMNVASGCPQFAELSVLDDDAYVKDDVLFVKCVVDTPRIFHP